MRTYAERLAEFVKVTGHRPGEMNDTKPDHVDAAKSTGDKVTTLETKVPVEANVGP